MTIPLDSWLVGSRGLYHGSPRGPWIRQGARQYAVLSLCRAADATYVGATGGLWEVRGETWTQRHDETLTEVLAVGLVQGDPGVIAGCPYGVALPALSRGGAWRWSFLDQGLSPDERFTCCLLPDPVELTRVWAGTEAGLFAIDLDRRIAHATNLSGTPVRSLAAAHGSLWAGTDTRGVWKLAEGGGWHPAGAGLSADAVFSLAPAADGLLLAGTSRGVAVGDGDGSWMLCGPRLLVSSLAVTLPATAEERGTWLAGASPGGLWCSLDRGEQWAHIPGHAYVRALAAPLPRPRKETR